MACFGGNPDGAEPAEDGGGGGGLLMQGTIWDAAMLVGLRKDRRYVLTWFQALVVLLLLAGNICLQAALVMAIGYNMADSPLTDEAREAVLEQRLYSFQNWDDMDAEALETKSKRLCNDLVYTQSSNFYSDIASYLTPDNVFVEATVGSLVSTMASLIFTLSMFREVYQISDEAKHVFFLEKCARGTDNVAFSPKANENLIRRMCWANKAFAFLVVLLPRLGIAVMLLLLGLSFISHTLSVEDLILNACALEVVKTADELVFRGLGTAKLRNTVLRTRFARPQRECCRWQGGVSSSDVASTAVRFVFVAFFVWLTRYAFLDPFTADVRAFEDALCGRDLNFAWREHPIAPVPFFTSVATANDVGDPADASDIEQFACFSAAGGDMVRIRAGFEALKSAPNTSLMEMILGESESCTTNGGSLVCPEVSLATLADWDAVTWDEYFHPDNCVNLEVHVSMIAETCNLDEYSRMVPWMAGRASCSDFADVCQCTSYDTSGFGNCAYTNLTAIQEACTRGAGACDITSSWVELLQRLCPKTCNTCLQTSRRLSGKDGQVEGVEEASAVAAAEAVQSLERRVAALEERGASLQRRGGSSSLTSLERRLAELEERADGPMRRRVEH